MSTQNNNKIKSVKGVDYDTFKKTALNQNLVQTTHNLSALDIDVNGNLSIAGIAVRTEDGVVENQLIKQILKVNPALSKMFENVVGAAGKKGFIDVLKQALVLSDVKKSLVNVIGNPNTGIITNILPGDQDYISNHIALDMFETTMNASSDLSLVNASITPQGEISLSVKKGEIVTPHTKKGMLKGEEFNPGYTFHNDPFRGMGVSHFVERLVCENGMTTRRQVGDFTLDILEDGAIRKFFENFIQLSSGGFVPEFLGEDIAKAMRTPVSFHELMTARKAMLNCSELKENEVSTFLPEFGAVAKQLAQKGIDYARCSDQQLKNYATSYNVWDVVNHLTWFGSHDTGHQTNRQAVQKIAGDMFGKKVYDTENLILV